MAAASLRLTAADLADIESVLAGSVGPKGCVFELERRKEGPHGAIMKYNLNQINRAAHLEELCRRSAKPLLYTHHIYIRNGVLLFVYHIRYLHLHFEGHPVEATRTGYRHPIPTDQPRLLQKLVNGHEKGFDFTQITLSSLKACGYDHSLGPCSEHEIREYCGKVNRLLREAEGVDEDSLFPDQLVDLRIITSQLQLELVQWREVQMYKKDLF